ncbi:L-dopachrome tautomerase-related protein [Agarivorans sp. 1_MG-2023]|uniref:L-dopachrome tautomerase-related protein n=1 Tax=Agarivorans sp. 1_MG-2023 TaxID=3062634 RepID=UPI0026E2F383|nr:L-dopachrome tautomerase-related protein [Agarivorans sp. 1_MG-2023]MDO6762367.1 L-dopachrome tautomerase-related protein [Agarivorans sp. 1_MG-2023]
MKKLSTLLALSTALLINPAQAADIEVVAQLEGTRPGNITVTPQGRTFLSMQPLDAPEFRVVELMQDGSTQPYPTQDWANGPEKGEVGFSSVIGIDSTKDGVVWILDMGSADAPAQIVAWDSVNNTLFKRIEISKDVMVGNSFLQDFALDTQRQQMYIADTSLGNLYGEAAPAFVVVDLVTSESRRVLQSHKALLSPEHEVRIDNAPMATKRENGNVGALYLGLNPITIDANNQWLYFGSVNGSAIYRIPAQALANEKLSADKLGQSIEFFSEKRPSDGMIISDNGNIYVGDIEKNAIGIANPNGYKIFAQDDKLLSWADGFSIQNGYLYVTQNSLHLHPAFNQGEEGSSKPYHVLRIKLD